jgi:hypothetical protein
MEYIETKSNVKLIDIFYINERGQCEVVDTAWCEEEAIATIVELERMGSYRNLQYNCDDDNLEGY